MDRRLFIAGLASTAAAAAPSTTTNQRVTAGNKTTTDNHDYFTHDYSLRDDEILDYSFYRPDFLPGFAFRGPAVDVENRTDFFSCIGAAQTLGVYSPTAFPELLRHQLGVTAWNLGVGGASPYFFLQHPEIFRFVNKGKFAILQVMTARDEPNDRIQPTPVSSVVKDLKRGDIALAHLVWQRILEEEPEKVDQYMAQSRSNWEKHMIELKKLITVPTIGFWFSPKPIDADVNVNTTTVAGLIGQYPQFINSENLLHIDSKNNPLITCFSDRMQRFSLRSKYTGKPVEVDYSAMEKTGTLSSYKESENIYYPSPQMHWDAATILGQVIRDRGLV